MAGVPHSITAETNVLGCLVVNQKLIDQALELGLDTDDFYRPAHREAWQTMVDLDAGGKPVDEIILAGLVPGLDDAEVACWYPVGGYTENIAEYIAVLKGWTDRRADFTKGHQLIADAGVPGDPDEPEPRGFDAPDDHDRMADRIESGDIGRSATPEALSPGDGLLVEDLATILARVRAAPPPTFLASPVWPADAYGVIAAQDKAGKTWAAHDLAVNVAIGGKWLGVFPCETPGTVLLFLGEGGERKTTRRLDAVARFYGTSIDALADSGRIRICHRVPHLARDGHIQAVRWQLDQHPAALVILDPLYLAAAGAKSSSLFEMAAVLEPIQRACQDHRAALVVMHHWNQTGQGKGTERMTGAGSVEWGRVLASIHVERRTTEGTATLVTLGWQFKGDEIPDPTLRIRRKVWAEDPADLGSPMHYEIEHLDDLTAPPADGLGLTPSQARVLAVLEKAGTAMTVQGIGDDLAGDDLGMPLKKRTIQDSLKALAEHPDGPLAHDDEPAAGHAAYWTAGPRLIDDVEAA